MSRLICKKNLIFLLVLQLCIVIPAQGQEYKLPDTLYFAGQRVPTEYLDVKERLYQIFYSMIYDKKGKVSHWLGKSGMFIPAIKKQLNEAGVHQDFAYITVAESELNYRVTSPANASGLWQFIKITGQRFNLRMDKQCDERNLLDKATAAAAKYLFHLQNNVFSSDPFLTLAAYNNGEGNVLKMIKAQNIHSFWEAISNSETSDYVCRVIVYKEIMSSPERYGLSAVTYNDYISGTESYSLEKLKKSLSYSAFAGYLNISYREFYLTNPHISHLGYNKGGFFDKSSCLSLQIPAGKSKMLTDSLTANGFLQSAIPDSVVAVLSDSTAKAVSQTVNIEQIQPAKEADSYTWHTVKEKSLGEIAFKYKKDWQKIAADNNLKIIELNSGLKVAEIRKGQKIKIYKD